MGGLNARKSAHCCGYQGGGDDIPADILKVVPDNLLNEFKLLIELCVGVGIDDAWGAPTGRPEQNLREAVQLLDHLGIKSDKLP
jgi:hypothetical protein